MKRKRKQPRELTQCKHLRVTNGAHLGEDQDYCLDCHVMVEDRTPTQGKRARAIAQSAKRAQLRAKLTSVIEAHEHLALDSERDRRQLVMALLQELAP